MGPLIHSHAWQRVDGLVKDTVQNGVHLLAAGLEVGHFSESFDDKEVDEEEMDEEEEMDDDEEEDDEGDTVDEE